MICKMKFMKSIIIAFVFITYACNNGKRPIVGATDFQREMNAKFKDATTSPLSASDLKVFKNLKFFEVDSTFVVKGVLKRTPNAEFFEMKTTTNRVSRERVFGIITINLQNKIYHLNVYQGEKSMESTGNEDYLFLPFLDDTNGEESYGGGRYIDVKASSLKYGKMKIDFNKAYNPWCAYSDGYNCPIPPIANHLDIIITSGESKYTGSKKNRPQ